MYSFKEKVSDSLSRLLQDTPDSFSPASTQRDRQARADSSGGKSLSSYFSHINPSSVFSGSKSTRQQRSLQRIQSTQFRYKDISNGFLEEHFDNLVDRNPGCRTKETTINHDNDRGSGRSASVAEEFEEAIEQQSPEKSLTDLTDNSVFISRDLYNFFLSCLPNIVKGCKWVLLYSTLKHGISLRTLIRKSSNLSGPCLLIVGDKQGAIFGGLLECPLKPTAKRKYQGTNQTFVFSTIHGEPRLFRPTGANRYFYLCLNDTLALGGGGQFALCLDGDLLNGTSGPCETFGNLCLAHNPEFELKNVELWGFIHSSQCLP